MKGKEKGRTIGAILEVGCRGDTAEKWDQISTIRELAWLQLASPEGRREDATRRNCPEFFSGGGEVHSRIQTVLLSSQGRKAELPGGH